MSASTSMLGSPAAYSSTQACETARRASSPPRTASAVFEVSPVRAASRLPSPAAISATTMTAAIRRSRQSRLRAGGPARCRARWATIPKECGEAAYGAAVEVRNERCPVSHVELREVAARAPQPLMVRTSSSLTYRPSCFFRRISTRTGQSRPIGTRGCRGPHHSRRSPKPRAALDRATSSNARTRQQGGGHARKGLR